MRHEFVGDDRDLFKWSLILDLAEPDKTVVYVPMARPDERLRSANDHHLRDDVKRYFRENRMNAVEAMCPSRISVASWDHYTNENREAYFDGVCRLLARDVSGTPRVVFLDPDTGMEPPRSSAKHVHVRDASLKDVWQSMRRDDILVVYQHAPLSKKDGWIAERKAQFAGAIGVEPPSVELRPKLDVCFFWSTKSALVATFGE